ncbi:hypothetical protein M569_13299 [Genlisea aurea]|uniref:Uncharacterized protein n=1 Tax=Genlisea aurea TaxID=192259 RepID=S8DFD3_9LAMI|nr:hypothetical protein M569_13299 [Genlisea aurea]
MTINHGYFLGLGNPSPPPISSISYDCIHKSLVEIAGDFDGRGASVTKPSVRL